MIQNHFNVFSFYVNLRPPSSPLFPYTTLFRSPGTRSSATTGSRAHHQAPHRPKHPVHTGRRADCAADPGTTRPRWPARSEEHTSELQSRRDLVCRLLLEKKKYKETESRHQISA